MEIGDSLAYKPCKLLIENVKPSKCIEMEEGKEGRKGRRETGTGREVTGAEA